MISLSPGLVIARKIRLDREIARGGMGSVWAAWNKQLETPVAVKFMSPEGVGSPELVTRFQREAKAAAQIRSPHVVQIFEHGMHLGQPYIVMELLEGEDLGTRIRRVERLSLPDTVDVVTQVCKALRRAHEMGIVHRDLKPANIFLARHDDDEVVKVLDFGIAKSLTPSGQGDDSTQTGTLVGTPHYMSPEQAQRSKQIDARSDLWSLGVIAFRTLTGRVPFKGDDMINVLVKVCTEPVPVPSSIAPDLGPEVDAIFARALNRDIDARFQSAREMSDAFGALLGRRSLASEISFGGAGAPASSRGSVPAPPPSFPNPPPAPPPPPSSAQPLFAAPPAHAPAPPRTARATDPPTVADEAAAKVDAADRTALDAVLSSPPGPLGASSSAPRSPPSAATGAALSTASDETLPPFRPSRTRAALLVGGAVILIGIIAAFVGSSGRDPGAGAAEASGSPRGSASVLAAPSPSVAPSLSASTDAPATPPATALASAPALTASAVPAPSSSGSARPASTARGTVPRSTSAPRSTGAIGGLPKF